MAFEGYITNIPSFLWDFLSFFKKKSIDITMIVCGLLSILLLIIGLYVYRYMLEVLEHIPINILKTFFFTISKIFLLSALSFVSILILILPETESLISKQPWRLFFVWALLLSRMSFLNSMTFLLLHLLLLPLSRLEAKSSLKLSRLYLMASGTMSRKSAIGHQCTACQKKRTDTAGNLCTYAYV